jgi:MoxR-like ATPase
MKKSALCWPRLVVRAVLGAAELTQMQQLVRRLPAPPTLIQHAVRLARSTRPGSDEASPEVNKYVRWGAGPRASQYLVLGAKARAALAGRAAPDLDDLRDMALPVLRHRMVLNFQGEAEGVRLEQLLAPMLAKTL